jgi:hypothetical protein
MNEVTDVELCGIPTPLAVSNLYTIHTHVESAVNAIKSKSVAEFSLLLPDLWHMKARFIGSSRIVRRDVRRIDREWKFGVGVMWYAIALKLPMSRDINRARIAQLFRKRRGFGGARSIMKSPTPIEKQRKFRDEVCS